MPLAPRRHRVFTAQTPESSDPLDFDVEVKDKAGKVTSTENFICYPLLQGAVILDFVSAASDENAAASAVKIMEFFDSALVPESRERFTALTHDPDRIMDIAVLSEIVSWLIEEYTDRPTIASE